jgi:hypothetical protein
MSLIGRLREEVEKAGTREDKKGLSEQAGMELKDEELRQEVGGNCSVGKLAMMVRIRRIIGAASVTG